MVAADAAAHQLGGIDGNRLVQALVKIRRSPRRSWASSRLECCACFNNGCRPTPADARRAIVGVAIGTATITLVLAARLPRIEEFTEATNRVLRRIVPGRRMIHFVSERLRLSSTVLFVATVHFVVDG